jgi:hypothetical protein
MKLLNAHHSTKCSEGLGFSNFYLQPPRKPLIENYTEIFHITDEGDIPSLQCKVSLRGPKSVRTLDCLSLIFITFMFQGLRHVPIALRPRCKLSENISLFAACRMYTDVSKETQEDTRCLRRIIYVYTCTIWGTGRKLVAHLLVYPLV